MARARDAKEQRLKELDLFQGADDKALAHLSAAADEVSVQAGRVLITQGHNHQEMYIIESGGASVEIDGEKIADIPAGELVGELAYFVRSPASATVTTSMDSELLIIPYNRFAQILEDSPTLALAIATGLAERLHATDARLHSSGDS